MLTFLFAAILSFWILSAAAFVYEFRLFLKGEADLERQNTIGSIGKDDEGTS